MTGLDDPKRVFVKWPPLWEDEKALDAIILHGLFRKDSIRAKDIASLLTHYKPMDYAELDEDDIEKIFDLLDRNRNSSMLEKNHFEIWDCVKTDKKTCIYSKDMEEEKLKAQSRIAWMETALGSKNERLANMLGPVDETSGNKWW
ncbi:hypothetical protein MMC28_007919 [Mycoblastus sanguinarius]|nr:hypothetical protein [Mycoblastus sanguinarius]